jgi:rhamnosyltransferase
MEDKTMINANNTIALIISYNPAANILLIVENIKNQVNKILIFDNGSESDTLIEKIRENLNCIIVKNSKNLGVSEALKFAKNYAIENGFSWLLTLDQDSIPTKDFIKKLTSIYEKYPEPEKIAILSPVHQEEKSKKIFEPDIFYKKISSNIDQNWIEVPWILTSGNLVRLEVFQKISGFDSNLFIDAVDTDFCFQCTDMGYKILVIPTVFMSHDVGYQVKGLIKKRLASIHVPIRNYYQFRNRILLWKRHYKKHFPWIMRDFVYGTKKLLDNLLFADQKLLRIKLIVRGLWHGIIGKTGPYS